MSGLQRAVAEQRREEMSERMGVGALRVAGRHGFCVATCVVGVTSGAEGSPGGSGERAVRCSTLFFIFAGFFSFLTATCFTQG